MCLYCRMRICRDAASRWTALGGGTFLQTWLSPCHTNLPKPTEVSTASFAHFVKCKFPPTPHGSPNNSL